MKIIYPWKEPRTYHTKEGRCSWWSPRCNAGISRRPCGQHKWWAASRTENRSRHPPRWSETAATRASSQGRQPEAWRPARASASMGKTWRQRSFHGGCCWWKWSVWQMRGLLLAAALFPWLRNFGSRPTDFSEEQMVSPKKKTMKNRSE